MWITISDTRINSNPKETYIYIKEIEFIIKNLPVRKTQDQKDAHVHFNKYLQKNWHRYFSNSFRKFWALIFFKASIALIPKVGKINRGKNFFTQISLLNTKSLTKY